jgi:hypothetical protein
MVPFLFGKRVALDIKSGEHKPSEREREREREREGKHKIQHFNQTKT